MGNVKIEAFKVIGISVRTSNQNGQAAQDIGALWEKFMSEGIPDQIPNKIDNAIYAVYTDYEGDYTQPYTTLLGCKVASLESIPEGMTGKSFKGGNYLKFNASGDLNKGVVYAEWSKIWKLDLNRSYTADFEVYGEKAMNPKEASVDIFIAKQE